MRRKVSIFFLTAVALTVSIIPFQRWSKGLEPLSTVVNAAQPANTSLYIFTRKAENASLSILKRNLNARNASIDRIDSFTFPPPVVIAENATSLHEIWAEIPHYKRIVVSENLQFSIVSAVPVFGKRGSYIALLTEGNRSDQLWQGFQKKSWEDLSRTVFFCSGPNRSHRSRVRAHGSVLMCPWPLEERYRESFDVHLESEKAVPVGRYRAVHDPMFSKQYQIMACVRDLYEPLKKSKRNGIFKELVQWMEWSLMNGVGHFLVYTFGGPGSLEDFLLKPYVAAGVVTVVHFDMCLRHPRTRHGYLINDCLFRAKNHAEWLMPVFDVDEYLYVRGGLANAFKENVFGNLDDVHSLTFKRIRFAKAKTNQLDISSAHYERPGGFRDWKNPKQFIHVDSVYRVSTHLSEVFAGDRAAVQVDPKIAVIHHYRHPYAGDADDDKDANETDESLLGDVARLTEAIRQRFRLKDSQDVGTFLERLAEARVPPCRGKKQIEMRIA
eukprot:Skav204101  [mRNA]  locus=scaffold1472:121695:123185:+ [translate_table: standard]